MNIGNRVKVLPPFDNPFDGVYSVVAIEGETFFLDGIEGGFAAMYLEAV